MINHFRTILINPAGPEGASAFGQYVDGRFTKIQETPAEEALRSALFGGGSLPVDSFLGGRYAERNFRALLLCRLMADCSPCRRVMARFDQRMTFDPRVEAIDSLSSTGRPGLIKDLWAKVKSSANIQHLKCFSEPNVTLLEFLVYEVDRTDRLDHKIAISACALCVAGDDKLDERLK